MNILTSIIDGIKNLFAGYNWLVIPAALLTIVFHEVSHGYVAYLLGDRTAKNAGRLTLNPIKHLDAVGLIAMIIFKFGWAKPVPVNPYFFKNRKGGMALVAFAGPFSNILFAIISLLAFKALNFIEISTSFTFIIVNFFKYFFYILAILNVSLAVFNIIPIPPLDGSKILNMLLPDEIYYKILQFEQFGFLILIVLLNIPFVSDFISMLSGYVLNGLFVLVGLQ